MEQLNSRLKKIERYTIISLFAISLFFIFLLVFVKWPNYWVYIASEQTPMTWMESVILFSCAFVSLICFSLNYVKDTWNQQTWIWAIIGCVFILLTLDERFAIHERIRDHYIKPTGLRILPWVGPGDFLLFFVLIAGLIFLKFVYSIMKQRKSAWRFFLAAVFWATIAVLVDSFDVAQMSKGLERLLQSIEEMIETIAQVCFLSSFILMVSYYFRRILLEKDVVK